MKVRAGFVSNSSTSSFVLVVTKKNFDKVLKNSDDLTKDLIKRLNIHETKKAFGKELTTIVWPDGNTNILDFLDSTEFVEKHIDKEEDVFEVIFSSFDGFIENLKKDKKNHIELEQEING
jgi:hypothetical protein